MIIKVKKHHRRAVRTDQYRHSTRKSLNALSAPKTASNTKRLKLQHTTSSAYQPEVRCSIFNTAQAALT